MPPSLPPLPNCSNPSKFLVREKTRTRTYDTRSNILYQDSRTSFLYKKLGPSAISLRIVIATIYLRQSGSVRCSQYSSAGDWIIADAGAHRARRVLSVNSSVAGWFTDFYHTIYDCVVGSSSQITVTVTTGVLWRRSYFACSPVLNTVINGSVLVSAGRVSWSMHCGLRTLSAFMSNLFSENRATLDHCYSNESS